MKGAEIKATHRSETAWPPLITDAEQPRWMRWRDRILTIVMWLLFLGMLIRQSVAFWRRVTAFLAAEAGTTWEFRLLPFLGVAAVMIVWLGLWAVLMYFRVHRAGHPPQPAPLGIEDEAECRGMTAADLAAARGLKIAAVAIDAAGRYRVAPGGEEPAQPS